MTNEKLKYGHDRPKPNECHDYSEKIQGYERTGGYGLNKSTAKTKLTFSTKNILLARRSRLWETLVRSLKLR
jgi:hypothetical protein